MNTGELHISRQAAKWKTMSSAWSLRQVVKTDIPRKRDFHPFSRATGKGDTRKGAPEKVSATVLVSGTFNHVITSETNATVDHLFAYTGRERDEETGPYYYL